MSLRAVLPLLVVAPLLVSCSACSESEEAKDLRAYSDWLDEMDRRQKSVLQGMESDRGTLESFLMELPQQIQERNLNQVWQGARASRDAFARIRDDVTPAFRRYRKTVDERLPRTEEVRDLHARMRRAAELRLRSLDSFSEIATLVEELVRAADEGTDAEREQATQEKLAHVNAVLIRFVTAHRETAQAIPPVRRTIEARLREVGDETAGLRARFARLLDAEAGLTAELHARLEATQSQIDRVVPILRVVEQKVRPDYDRIVEQLEGAAVPTDLRESWDGLLEILRKRRDTIREVAGLGPKIEEIVSASPVLRSARACQGILERVPTAMQEWVQAEDRYAKYLEEVRRLRAKLL
jgi:hypothetical protein